MASIFDADALVEYTYSYLQSRAKRERKYGIPTEMPPRGSVLRKIFSILFHSSLKTEEGRSIQVRVFYLNPAHPDVKDLEKVPEDRWRFYPLTSRIPLTTANLTKFAKAADPWTTGVAIFNDSAGLYIWGILDQVVHFSTSVVYEGGGTYLQPGVFHALVNGPADITVMVQNGFVVRQAQDVLIKRENDCLSKGPVARIVKEWTERMFLEIVCETDKLGIQRDNVRWKPFMHYGWIETVSRILIHIQRQRHGGAVLITASEALDDISVKYKIDYTRVRDALYAQVLRTVIAYSTHDEFFRADLDGNKTIQLSKVDALRANDKALQTAKDTLTGAVRCAASFAGVDGTVVLDPQLKIRGFGAIIDSQQPLEKVVISRVESGKCQKVIDVHSFGTRHRSMIRYCYAHPGALGFVISQDGDIRAVTKIGHNCVIFDNLKVQYFED